MTTLALLNEHHRRPPSLSSNRSLALATETQGLTTGVSTVNFETVVMTAMYDMHYHEFAALRAMNHGP
ncbi:hypothetical protein PC116_g18032 [Phytophthora cactorum]|uniref:Uncharacterized protein n=1 Tax=Phytophthora cactorum TaxID=29920 RepID=A0A8T0YSP6_9STRA|nr:hypothetical protein PC112_g13941 [Phytophthora cactorum]KAG2816998.1 hypothetical protein PC111_g12907 [Phytophthora cactorum]KAG2853307.1 hypothetical protein PC113_g14279 [Phytophthora cactorum]KAG2896203.1 hypothetical protein PC114_g15184 [Phytophthora cactorum]KAG2909397.1 hypothetical protein PC115_g13280 [Phytophthora cactorum]